MPPPHHDTTGRNAPARDAALPWRKVPWLALAGSTGVHAVLFVLFVLFVNFPVHERFVEPSDRTITMRLAPLSPTDPQPPIRQQESTDADTGIMGAATDASIDPPVNAPPDTPAPKIDAQEAATAESGNAAAPMQDPAALRTRILEQIAALPASEANEAQSTPWPGTGESLPGLPGVRGWISGYVGRVRPGADTWKANDGSTRGRYVMADGTLVCTQRRAPTIDEMVNPWKSTVVTMGRLCGRKRPEMPDFTNPRVQPPARAAGNGPAFDD